MLINSNLKRLRKFGYEGNAYYFIRKQVKSRFFYIVKYKSRQQATGDGQQATGDGQQATGNRLQVTGDRAVERKNC